MMNHVSFLYVEDDARNRQVMELLMTRGMGVQKLTIFADSQNFLDRVRQLPEIPDVALLDIHVPPHDGFAMLDMLRQEPSLQHIKVIALTASVMNEEVEQLRMAGFDGAISKPLNMTIFPDLIQRILAGESVWYIV